MENNLEKRILEITEYAQKNGNVISSIIAVDLLKNKSDYTQDEIESAMDELKSSGINVVSEEDEDYPSDETNPETFIPAEVNIGQRPVNIYNLMERLANNEIDLNPDFQRNDNLWSVEQQSRLIESLMLKIPIPAFYFNATDESSWIVIDGLQRLTAFNNFLVGGSNKQKFVGLQYLKDFNGLTFDELPRQYIRRIQETPVIAYTVEKGTPEEIVFNIFQRINTGGIPLNPQEIRQALYNGKGTSFIEHLAKNSEFLNATQNAIRTDRMQDREYVSRYIAFTELDYRNDYKGNIDNFLIKAIKLLNNYEDEKFEQIEKHFSVVMKHCAEMFGKFAFRKYDINFRRGPINKALFEMWVVIVSELSAQQLDMLKTRSSDFLIKFGELQRNAEFITLLKSGDKNSVLKRIEMARAMVKEFLCLEK